MLAVGVKIRDKSSKDFVPGFLQVILPALQWYNVLLAEWETTESAISEKLSYPI